MRIIRGLTNYQAGPEGCVLSIGNFDGVHLGHQVVINHLAEKGRELGLPVNLLVFEPQPLEYFLGDNAPSRLTRLRGKVLPLTKLPIDDLIVMKFDRQLANCDPELFISDFLIHVLNIKYLVVGDDFHFGKARRGNFHLLKEKGAELGFEVEDTASYQIDHQRVSSTLIRDALDTGDLDRAACLLGRAYSVCGRVLHGEKRGRKLGYPTANIAMNRKNTPIEGVFAVIMTGIGNSTYQGIANVGIRPTFEAKSKVILEAHLFEFDQEIYGSYVEIHFLEKIRDEIAFKSLDELVTQIERDIAQAKIIHQHRSK